MGADALADYLLPKLRRCASRDKACAYVLKAIADGRSLDNAILDAVEAYSPTETLRIRKWVEEARGEEARARRDPTADEDAGDELVIYCDNEADLYKWKQRVAAQLHAKLKAGKYDHKKAVKAWAPIIETGAKRYAKEYATAREWATIFTPATRDYAAQQLADRWYANAKAGRPEEV